MTSSSKNLKIDIQEQGIREVKSGYMTNSMLRNDSQIEIPSLLSKSTKNLYGQFSKD